MYQPNMPQLHLVVPAPIALRRTETERVHENGRQGPSRRPVLTLLPGVATSGGRADGPGRLLRFPDLTPPPPQAA